MMPKHLEILKQRFAQQTGLPFQELLSESTIEQVLEEEKVKYRNRLYSPIVVLWAFLSQVFDSDKSLSNAVKRMCTWSSNSGVEPPSINTGGYAKARQRLPERVVERLFYHTGPALEAQTQPEDLWCGRPVKIIDGSSALMADTQSNQADYPQHSNQANGCGFPMVKLVVMFSLATAAAIAVRMGSLHSGEVSLARPLYETLEPNDVVLADRAYGSYVDLALVQQQEADGVFRKHHRRSSDFRKGRRLGKNDHLVTWTKPKRRPNHMSKEAFDALAQQLQVREVRFSTVRKGFRTRSVTVVTTLLDPKVYSKEKLAELYRLRWQAEIDLNHVKTTLGMEMLRGKTPEMVRKEIYVHLMAYNLIRGVMWQAGQKHGVSPLRLSVQGTRQQLNHSLAGLAEAGRVRQVRLYRTLLKLTAQDILPDRPGRSEPRQRKRRPKPFPLMKQPRSVLKAKLAA